MPLQHHAAMQQVQATMNQQEGKAFNESKVRQAAEQGSAARVDMMVSRAKMHNEIYSELTAEQRKLYDKGRHDNVR